MHKPEDIFNPRIVDASIRDVTACLDENRKTEVLLHATERLLENGILSSRTRTILENAVQSCLELPSLSPAAVARVHILRARARLYAGASTDAIADLRRALAVEPENVPAKTLLQQVAPSYMDPAPHLRSASSRFSIEIWHLVCSHLPRFALLPLLRLGSTHPLVCVAREAAFSRLELRFGCEFDADCDEPVHGRAHSRTHVHPPPHTHTHIHTHGNASLGSAGSSASHGDAGPEQAGSSDPEQQVGEPAGAQDASCAHASPVQRSVDILAQLVSDPAFAARVRTLRLHAVCTVKGGVAFQIALLAKALPNLKNLRNVHCAAMMEDMASILWAVYRTCPNLRGLSILYADGEQDYLDDNPFSAQAIPSFNGLRHFSYASNAGGTGSPPWPLPSVTALLKANATTLRKVRIENRPLALPVGYAPEADVLALHHLTHLDLMGQAYTPGGGLGGSADPGGGSGAPLHMNAFEKVLSCAAQLTHLRLHVVLRCAPSGAFRAYPTALPRLTHFSFAVASVHRNVTDRDLFPAITDFLRAAPRPLRSLRLCVCDSETVQAAVGYDAAVWGVLPALQGLRRLWATYPRGLAPGLAGWLVPREVRSLGFDGMRVLNGGPRSILNQMRTGMPQTLHFLSVRSFAGASPADIVEEGFPMIHLLRVGDEYWSARWREEWGRADPAGRRVLELEEWPRKRAQCYKQEWLERLECEEVEMDYTQFQ